MPSLPARNASVYRYHTVVLDTHCVHCEGVGAELAEAILRVYPTPLLLRNAYEDAMKQAPSGAAVQRAQGLLAGLIVSPARKISVNQSAKVFDSLFAAGWHCV